MNFWPFKNKAEPVAASDAPPAGWTPAKFAESADAFVQSPQWPFFLALCAQQRDAHLRPPADVNGALCDHACATLMKDLPAKVRGIVMRRQMEKQREADKALKAAEKASAGRIGGSRAASRPMSA